MQDKIHVVVDTIAVSHETPLNDDPRCHVLRLITRHGNEEWWDGERSLEEMFAMVEKTGQLPGTSQPPVGYIHELFANLAKEGKKVIYIAVDSVLSGTYQTCCMVAKQVMSEIKGADIRCVDGLTAACPLSGMAMEVLRLIDSGVEDMDKLEAFARDCALRTETYFTVKTLDYLQKGGRIGAVGALVGNILGIRPIVHLDREGKLLIGDKARTRKKVLKRMVELACSHDPIEEIFVAHAVVEDEAQALAKEMQERYPGVPVMVTSIGTVLAAHLGPGAIGVFVRRKA